MSMDIRSYFSVKTAKQTNDNKLDKKIKKKVNKIDSDSDDEFVKISKKQTNDTKLDKKIKKRVNKIDSDSDDEFVMTSKKSKQSPKKETPKKKLKEIDRTDLVNLFSASSNSKNKTEDKVKKDDSEKDNQKKNKSPLTNKEKLKTEKSNEPSKSEKNKETFNSQKLENSRETSKSECNKRKEHKDIEENSNNILNQDVSNETNQVDLNETNQVGSAKKNNYANYQRYLARGKPKNLGNKIIPEGRPGCLAGLTFVITGVLDSLERDDAAELIKKYDGRVTQSVSKNTTYILLGEEPGESKLNKAKTLGIKQISEDELLEKIKLSKDKEISPIVEKNIKINKLTQKKKVTPISKQKQEEIQTTRIKKEVESSSTKSEEIKIDMAPSSNSQLWVDKYKPTSLSQLIGPKTEKSNPKKLFKWLQDWHKNNKKPGNGSKAPFNELNMKAVLLSGAPGIGKTTTAHLVCKELNYDIIEFNASDTRSQRLLREQVEEILSSKSISNFGSDNKSLKNKVLIMDEVDGMAGNEDRGGVAELINLIKHTKIPIICICNDRQHPKIRSLVHYCLDLRFYKINLEPIRSAMMSICFKEKININAKALDQIIMATNHDIRQTMHNLSLWSSAGKSISVQDAEKESARNKKSMKMGPWDVARKILSSSENQSLSLNDKNDLFFQDYDLGPLFVQENYLNVQPDLGKGNIYKTLDCLANTADNLSIADIIDKQIRTYSRWSLLLLKSMHSFIIPSHYMSGRIGSMINFPSWFGKNSKRTKFNRILKELQYHTTLKISGNLESFNLDYAQSLKDNIYNSLFKDKMDGVKPCLDFMLQYNILRSDVENLIEVTSWDSKDYWATIDSKVKAALTREFNKSSAMIPFAISMEVKKKKKSTEEYGDDEEEEEVLQDDDTKLKLDPMIKERKRKAPAEPKETTAAKKRKVTTNKKNK